VALSNSSSALRSSSFALRAFLSCLSEDFPSFEEVAAIYFCFSDSNFSLARPSFLVENSNLFALLVKADWLLDSITVASLFAASKSS
jgi:hypothetical protein